MSIQESFLVDWALETSADLWGTKAYRTWMNDEDQTKEKIDEAMAHFRNFNRQIADNLQKRPAGQAFFAGNRLTIADFVLFSHYMSMVYNDFNKRKVVKTAQKEVAKTPIIGKYVAHMKKVMSSYL